MKRRTFLTTAAGGPAILKGLSKSKPNLMIVMSDQHRPDFTGYESGGAIHTPNLDRIAREGVRFRHAYSTTPTCTPARAALLTGMSPWKHGMLGYFHVAEKYAVEMPQVLRDAGYYTFGIGKMHWTPQRSLHGFHQTVLDESGRAESKEFRSDYRAWFYSQAPLLNPDETGIGFNDYKAGVYKLQERLHPTRWTGDTAVNFIEQYVRPEPFFLKVSFARPHSPYDPPGRFMHRYEGARLPERAVGKWAAKYARRSWERDDIWHGDMGPDVVRHSRQGYAGSVTFIDEQIGRILETLEKRKLLDETLIVYFSDHGDMTGDHHLWRKSYAYEASARIPMLVRGPGAAKSTVNETPVEIRDVLPTLCAAAGISAPEQCDGQNMLAAKREWIDLEHDVCYDKTNHWTAVTDGKWKYIYHAYDGSEQLFDLVRDPREIEDLASSPAHEGPLRLWRGRMIAHLEVRGENWVRGGKLLPRPESMLRSPNYPSSAAVK